MSTDDLVLVSGSPEVDWMGVSMFAIWTRLNQNCYVRMLNTLKFDVVRIGRQRSTRIY
ncbi:hypothetical protein HanIR_Chr06g0281041 [Helianthus annuus]|nr:hypothetical protein HanIR_Chr06g0281041 [Helianthus annuus]